MFQRMSLSHRVLIYAISLGCLSLHQVHAQPARPPAFVVVAKVVQRKVANGRTYVATVVPSKQATIGSAIDGRIDEFPINEGDRVSAGKKLAQLLTQTITKEHEAALAELDLREAELEELENGSRPQEIEQARASMQAREASLEFLLSRKKRLQVLVDRSVATAEEMQQIETATQAARESLAEAKATYDLAVEGPRQEKIKQKKAQVAAQQAVVQRLCDQKRKHTIITRFDGYISEEHTELGAWVNRGDPVATVVALDEVDLLANVVEGDISALKLGMSIPVRIDALKHKLWTGTVHAIVPQADERSRTFPVKIRVKNEFDANDSRGTAGSSSPSDAPVDESDEDENDESAGCEYRDPDEKLDEATIQRNKLKIPLIKGGMLARVTLPTGDAVESILIPKDALVLNGPSTTVWVTSAAPQPSPNSSNTESKMLQAPVRSIPVKLGVADGEYIQVSGDLKPGEYVVIEGNERIFPAGPDAPLVRWNESEVLSPDSAESGSGPNEGSGE